MNLPESTVNVTRTIYYVDVDGVQGGLNYLIIIANGGRNIFFLFLVISLSGSYIEGAKRGIVQCGSYSVVIQLNSELNCFSFVQN